MSGVAIVTGSSGGIGREVCLALQRKQYQIVGIDRVPSSEVETLVCDLADTNFTEELGTFDTGTVSLIVHCAAHQPTGPIYELTTEDWESANRVSVGAVQKLASKYRTSLIESRGSIICLSSIHSHQTSPKMAAYAAAKAALDSWVRSAAIEYGPEVAVMGLSLGAIDTPKLREGIQRWPAEERKAVIQRLVSKTPIGRLGTAKEIAEWVAFLSDPAARFASGSVLSVNGGVSAWLGSE